MYIEFIKFLWLFEFKIKVLYFYAEKRKTGLDSSKNVEKISSINTNLTG